MAHLQLEIEFTDRVHERAPNIPDSKQDAHPRIVSKQEYIDRTRALWDAVERWLLDYTPATSFWRSDICVYDKIECDWTGSFSDADQVRTLQDEFSLASGIAIAAEEASLMMEEHGHPDDASVLVRTYYLALAINTLGYDLEHYLPGFPVHSLTH